MTESGFRIMYKYWTPFSHAFPLPREDNTKDVALHRVTSERSLSTQAEDTGQQVHVTAKQVLFRISLFTMARFMAARSSARHDAAHVMRRKH